MSASGLARAKPARLVLASRSPRRRELLASAGIPHEVRDPGLDDSELQCGEVTPAQWVAALAHLKAAAGRERLRERGEAKGRIVLGADTTCVEGRAILGTPRDAEEARWMLRRLEGREHEVLTGVSLLDCDTGDRLLFVDRARVRLGSLGGRIDEYVATGQWAGKAGGYSLSERLAAGWPIEYVGDPSTIMGLPLRALTRRLSSLGLSPAGEAA